MVLVAVVGGTSPTLGKSIVTAILATNRHKAVILSRPTSNSSAVKPGQETKYGAPVYHVDYNSISSLTNALKDVDTVISVLKIPDQNVMFSTHQTLLEACKSSSVSRFVMSDWALHPKSHSKVDLLANKAKLLELCEQENNRPDSSTACSTIQVGAFMNYFAQGSPSVADNEEELAAGLVDPLMLQYLDIANGVLQIPSTPGPTKQAVPVPVSHTHILDIGTVLAAALDLPPTKLRGALGITSQTFTFEHVRSFLASRCNVHIPAQPITRADCDVKAEEAGIRLSKAIEDGGFDVQALMDRLAAQLVAVQCDGDEGGAVVEPTLNRMLDDAGIAVRLRTVEDMLLKAWGK